MAESNGARMRRAASGTTIINNHGFAAVYARFRESSFVMDYIGLVIVMGLDILLRIFVEPFHRMFYLDNPAIQFPHADPDRVPPVMLFVYAGVVPLAVLAVWAIIARPNVQKVHVTYLALFISVFLTVFLTDIIKNAVGRPRPDLLARCKPARDTPKRTLVTFEVCTETSHHLLHDGWRSFPSGHSSFSFAGLGFLSIFLAGQLQVFRPRTPFPHLLISLCPFMLALLIAISRCEDYRHDVYDISVGTLIGLVIAYLSYRRVYPGLTESGCENPYPSLTDSQLPKMGKARDEEEHVGMRNSGEGRRGSNFAPAENGDDESTPSARLMGTQHHR